MLTRVVNAVRGGGRVTSPRPGLMVGMERSDFSATIPGDLNPDRFRRLLNAALRGDGDEVNDLYDHVLRIDGHLRSVVSKRLSALRRLEWEIIAAQGDEGEDDFDAEFAADVARFCRRTLRRCHGLDAALDHLTEAIGRGVACVELEWATVEGERRPVSAVCVPHRRLAFDPMDPWRLRITSEKDFRGLPIDEHPAGKFIAHAPDGVGANAMAMGLLLPSAWLVVFKRFGWNFYFQTLEAFGAPMVTATYAPGATQDVIDGILTMLSRVSKLRSGAFPQGTGFEFHEPASSSGAGKGPPHPPAIELCNAEISKLWQGGTLMTEVGSTGGNRAVADVQNEGLTALRDDDARAESATITEQMLRPIVVQRFGEEAADYVPTFRRVTERAKDIDKMARVVSVAVNDLDAPVPMRYVQDELGIPLVEGTDLDAPLPGRRTGFEGPSRAGLEIDAADETSADRLANSGRRAHRRDAGATPLRVVANSLMDTIRARGGSLARIVPWMVAAVIASQTHTAAVAAALDAVLKREEESISTEADVGRVLGGAFARLPIEDMVTLSRHALLAGELAGRATALEKIVERGAARSAMAQSERRARRPYHPSGGRDTRTTPARTTLADTTQVINAAKIDFARIPFVAAIERLRDRIGLEPDEFLKLDAEARSRAWRVAGVWNMDLLAVLHTQLVSAIAAGETVRDFRQSVIGQMYDRAGWSGENPHHANVVFFQNFAMAHSAGRWREYAEAAVERWRFVANGESCPICTPEVGRIYRMSDTSRFPPLHFNCDCEDEPVFEGEEPEDATSDGPDYRSNLALLEYRQKPSAFVWNPASYAAFTPLNLAKYPEALRPAFAALAAAKGWEVAP